MIEAKRKKSPKEELLELIGLYRAGNFPAAIPEGQENLHLRAATTVLLEQLWNAWRDELKKCLEQEMRIAENQTSYEKALNHLMEKLFIFIKDKLQQMHQDLVYHPKTSSLTDSEKLYTHLNQMTISIGQKREPANTYLSTGFGTNFIVTWNYLKIMPALAEKDLQKKLLTEEEYKNIALVAVTFLTELSQQDLYHLPVAVNSVSARLSSKIPGLPDMYYFLDKFHLKKRENESGYCLKVDASLQEKPGDEIRGCPAGHSIAKGSNLNIISDSYKLFIPYGYRCYQHFKSQQKF